MVVGRLSRWSAGLSKTWFLKAFKICLYVIVGLHIAQRTLFYYFPVPAVLVKNRIRAFLGWEEFIDLEAFQRDKTDEFGYLGHYKLHNFSLSGVHNSQIIYTLQGDSLTFQDKKIWLVRTPLIKLGVVEHPTISIFPLNGEKVSCAASIGEYYNKEKRIVLKSNAFCTTAQDKFYVRAVNVDIKLGKLTATRYSGRDFVQHIW